MTGEEKEYRLSPADEEVLSAYHSLPRPEQVYILSEMYRRAGRISSPAEVIGEDKRDGRARIRCRVGRVIYVDFSPGGEKK